MQAKNYGNGIDTHIALIMLCARGRKALATSAAPDSPAADSCGPERPARVIAWIYTETCEESRFSTEGPQVSWGPKHPADLDQDWRPVYDKLVASGTVDLPAAPSSGESADAEPMEDPIMVPRGLIGAACYVLRKDEANGKLLAKLRALTFDRPAPATHSSAPSELLTLLVESQDSIGGDWRVRRDAAVAKALAAPTGESLPGQGVVSVPSPCVPEDTPEDEEEVDQYGNPLDGSEIVNCCFPDCGCDGARLCMAKNGANNSACSINIERGSLAPTGASK